MLFRSVPLINGGHTPARDVRTAFKVRVVDYPLQESDFWDPIPENILYSLLGPNAERQINAPAMIDHNAAAAIATRQKCLIAQFAVSYVTYNGESVTEPPFVAIAFGADFEGAMKIATPRFLRQSGNKWFHPTSNEKGE